MVRTTGTLVYGGMKEKIQKVLSDSCGKDNGGVPVKEEDCFYTNRKGDYKKGGSNKKQNYFGKSKIKSGTNPMDSDGNMNKYDCVYHFSMRKSWFSDWEKTISAEEWMN